MSTRDADLSSLRIDRSKRADSSGQKKSKKFLYLSGLAVIIIILVTISMSNNSHLFSAPQEVTLVSASLQSPSLSNAVLTASGYVVAQRKAAVASKGTGRLVYLGVVEGDKVRQNQVIARLEDDDIRAMLNEAKASLKVQEAELKVAESNFNRQKSLFDSRLVSQYDVDLAESNYNRVLASIDLAGARLEAAEVSMENTRIRAPFDGTVLTKNADVGEIVAPLAAGANSRAAVVTIADMSSLQVETDVSEANIEKIHVNSNCEISLDAYPTIRYEGFVAKIVPTADRAKATVLVKVGFNSYDERVLPEMSAKVVFLNQENLSDSGAGELMLMVPESAVTNRNGRTVVYMVKENFAREMEVTSGRKVGNYIQILSGVENGMRVIKNPNDQISDGVSVHIN